MTKPELKKRVLKHLNEHGDTFVDITPVILNTGIDQTHIKYLLDELQTDKLIILSKNNPHLNSIGANGHVLTAASNVQARITPQGRDHVKQHFASSSWLDYLEKHPVIRAIALIGAIGGGIAIILGIILALA